MTPSPQALLQVLPPYRDEWVLISPDQSVKDIINEVLEAHKEFGHLYDNIALFFNDGTIEEVAESLYNFCRDNLKYKEESEEFQSTSVPQGLLSRGYCDCKGYAGFIAGVLSALERANGTKINWAYRFASYDPLESTPHHVFVVLKTRSGELWIDPTPGSDSRTPFYWTDKKVSTMPLHRNIAGVRRDGAYIGIASLYVNLATDWGKELAFENAPWPSTTPPDSPWLGFDIYRDYGGDRNIGEADLANRINAAIANGPSPGHTVTADFVKWVYDNSIRSWNFYWPGGVNPSFDYSKFIPKTFSWTDSAGNRQTISPPLWVVTPDHRVTFDHDVKLDDYRNWLIHILTAGAQNYINNLDSAPFPLKPADLKNFSQAYSGNPNNPAASILKEWRGSSDLAKFIQTTTSFITNTAIKIIGSIPRNAFLALVGINLFHMATDLQNHINNGGWSDISGTWKMLGGDPDKLLSTIHHGSTVPETDNTQQTVTSPDQVTGVSIGNPAVVAAVITAATPVILALAKYFSHSSVSSIASNGVLGLNSANPNGNYQMVNGQLYSNGQPVNFSGQTETQQIQSALVKNLLIGAGVGAGTYFVTKKGKRGKGNLGLAALLGGGTFLLLQYYASKQVQTQAPINVTTLPSGAVPSTATPGIVPSLLPGVTNLIKVLTTPNQGTPTPTSPVTAGSGSELPPDFSSTGSEAFAV